jgi:hypothetical protein
MERKKAVETFARLSSTQAVSPPQALMRPVQNENPPMSGCRLRKSWYCWQTNDPASSIGFCAGWSAASASETAAKSGRRKLTPGEAPTSSTKNVSPAST